MQVYESTPCSKTYKFFYYQLLGSATIVIIIIYLRDYKFMFNFNIEK